MLAPVLCSAQRTFTYQPSDYQAVAVGQAAQISVRTTIIVLGDPNAPVVTGPTNTFSVRLHPPQGQDSQLLNVMVEDRLVDVTIHRSNIDGDLEVTASIPVSAGNSPELKVDWATKDQGVLESTVEVTASDKMQSIHASTGRIFPGSVRPMPAICSARTNHVIWNGHGLVTERHLCPRTS